MFIAPPDFKPVNAGLTATPAGTQTTSLTLRFGVNQFTTVAVLGDAATLPTSTGGGRTVVVQNIGANQMNIFPDVGSQINNIAVNSPQTQSAGQSALYIDSGAGKWSCIRSV